MPILTEKQNYFRLLDGEVPEYVPQMIFGMPMGPPEIFPMFGGWDGIKYDLFGVPYVTEKNANYGGMPQSGVFILDDITKWRDVIKRPKVLDEIDWQLCADRDLANWDPNTINNSMVSIGNGYFQMLGSFMGFENGLIACVEEPEEVKALLNFLLEMNLELLKKSLFYYKPETFGMGDDIAAERSPFVSLEMFLDIFEPIWRKTIEPALDAGIYCEHHNCGKLDEFIPYIVDEGFCAWNPAQPANDLVTIKEKFKGKLAICGGFDGNGPVCYPETPEEDVRAYVRQVLDELAPGGGYAFGGYVMGAPDDPQTITRMGWIQDEFEKRRYDYYK
ncbi:MAG: hypothetical protein LBU61_01190 [Coriobacteriales bacterium]|jgi:hypothetical protein|nr:hypothetical protein [Coriobacteriales bacterium]